MGNSRKYMVRQVLGRLLSGENARISSVSSCSNEENKHTGCRLSLKIGGKRGLDWYVGNIKYNYWVIDFPLQMPRASCHGPVCTTSLPPKTSLKATSIGNFNI